MNLRKYLALMVIVILAACQANQTARGSSIDTVAVRIAMRCAQETQIGYNHRRDLL